MERNESCWEIARAVATGVAVGLMTIFLWILTLLWIEDRRVRSLPDYHCRALYSSCVSSRSRYSMRPLMRRHWV